jgi:hypothetical protein
VQAWLDVEVSDGAPERTAKYTTNIGELMMGIN